MSTILASDPLVIYIGDQIYHTKEQKCSICNNHTAKAYYRIYHCIDDMKQDVTIFMSCLECGGIIEASFTSEPAKENVVKLEIRPVILHSDMEKPFFTDEEGCLIRVPFDREISTKRKSP